MSWLDHILYTMVELFFNSCIQFYSHMYNWNICDLVPLSFLYCRFCLFQTLYNLHVLFVVSVRFLNMFHVQCSCVCYHCSDDLTNRRYQYLECICIFIYFYVACFHFYLLQCTVASAYTYM